jgi:glycosyltransferase involved in cell wall biosynthesis
MTQVIVEREQSSTLELTVIAPFYNEEDNVRPLYEQIKTVLEEFGRTYEIVFINDGSADSTGEKLAEIARADPAVQYLDLLRNYGQTAAMMAGFDRAQGEIIISMDGDGQNDPAEIPNLLAELEKGFDVVSGWRRNRKDKALSRRLPSIIANALISRVTGVKLHDYGCSLKAYRHEILKDVRLYGEMHRFIPIYAVWQGGRIAEIEVNHRARQSGESSYGISRTLKVLLDLLLVTFLERYMNKPIYVFGGAGMFLLFLSLLTALWAIGRKVFLDSSFISSPLPMLTGTFFSTGVVCVLMGLMAELIMRTYYETQDKSIYQVRKPPKLDKN